MKYFSTDSRSRHYLIRAIPYLLLFAAPFIGFLRTWAFRGEGAKFFWGDTNTMYWPDLVFFYNALASGDIPLWNPFERGGLPVVGQIEAGLMYPVNWILVLYGLVAGSMPFSVLQFKIVLHLSMAGIFMYMFLRNHKLAPVSAVIGGLGYQFSPYMMHHVPFSIIWSASWIPLVFLGIDWLFQKRNIFSGFFLAASIGLCVAAGSPPSVYYAFIIALPYFIMLWYELAQKEGFKQSLKSIWPALAVASVLTIIFLLPVLVPARMLFASSIRSFSSFGFIARGAVEPWELPALIIRTLKKQYMYVGIIIAMCALIGALKGTNRRNSIFFVIITILGLMLAMGGPFSLFNVFYAVFPPARWFRIPYRYIYIIGFTISVLAAYGMDAVLKRDIDCRLLIKWIAAGLGVLLLYGMYLAFITEPGEKIEILRELFLVPFVGGLGLVCLYYLNSRSHRKTLLIIMLVALAVVDYISTCHKTGALHQGEFAAKSRISTGLLKKIRSEAASYRIYDEFAIGWRSGSRLGLRDFRGYTDAFQLYRFYKIKRLMQKNPLILRLFNIKYVLKAPQEDQGFIQGDLPELENLPGFRKIEEYAWEVQNPMPVSYFVSRAEINEDYNTALERLEMPYADTTAVFFSEDLTQEQKRLVSGLAGGPGNMVPGRVVSRSSNTIDVEVDAPSEGILMVNEVWFPGWRVYVDGKSAQLLRANGIVRAVHLEPGRHRVSMKFVPMYFIVPAVIAILAVIGMFLMLIVPASRKIALQSR